MLLAGEDTTANTLAWMIYLLDRHPVARSARAARKLRVSGPVDSVDLRAHRPLRATSKPAPTETMRLKPVAPTLADAGAARHRHRRRAGAGAASVVWGAMRSDSLNERHFPRRPSRFDPRTLARQQRRRHTPPSSPEPRVDAVRCRSARLPGSSARDDRDQERHRHAAEHASRSSPSSTPDGGEAVEHLAFTMAPVGLRMRLRVRTLSGAAAASARSDTSRAPKQRSAGQRSSACRRSAIRSATASRPIEKRTSVRGGRAGAAQQPEVVGHDQADRPGPRIADAEQPQRVDEGVDAFAAVALVEDHREQPGGRAAAALPVGVARAAGQRRMQHLRDLGAAVPASAASARAAASCARVAQRAASAASAARLGVVAADAEAEPHVRRA